MKHIISLKNEKIQKEEWAGTFYRLFWIYVICGVGGFLIESIWCWIDFHEFTSRTSNRFFPISCIWDSEEYFCIYLLQKIRKTVSYICL